jgi:hypothetical protein
MLLFNLDHDSDHGWPLLWPCWLLSLQQHMFARLATLTINLDSIWDNGFMQFGKCRMQISKTQLFNTSMLLVVVVVVVGACILSVCRRSSITARCVADQPPLQKCLVQSPARLRQIVAAWRSRTVDASSNASVTNYCV